MQYVAQGGNNFGGLPVGGGQEGGKEKRKQTWRQSVRGQIPELKEEVFFRWERCVRSVRSKTLFREQHWLGARPWDDSERGVIAAYLAACWIVLLGSSDSITPLRASAHLAVCAEHSVHSHADIIAVSWHGTLARRIRTIICS